MCHINEHVWYVSWHNHHTMFVFPFLCPSAHHGTRHLYLSKYLKKYLVHELGGNSLAGSLKHFFFIWRKTILGLEIAFWKWSSQTIWTLNTYKCIWYQLVERIMLLQNLCLPGGCIGPTCNYNCKVIISMIIIMTFLISIFVEVNLMLYQ